MHNFEYIGSIYTRRINLASLLQYSNVIIYVLSIKIKDKLILQETTGVQSLL